MGADLKGLITLMRRVKKSPYSKVLMNNRMMMNCYDVRKDDDVGFHYILHIPKDDELYSDGFYDLTMMLDINEITDLYREGHTELSEVKKEKKAKPKDCIEEFAFDHDTGTLVMSFIVCDEVVCNKEYVTEYPVSSINTEVENITNTYVTLGKRIKSNGYLSVVDGFKSGFVFRAFDNPQIAYAKVKVNDVKVKIPLYKSMFLGYTDLEEMKLTVQESNIKDVYVLTVHLTKKGLTEQLIGYVMNF